MGRVTDETFKWAHKPFDIVSDISGNVGFIQEVGVNNSQDEREHQISYAVNWMVSGGWNKHAWFCHSELKVHGNILIKIAESACHPLGGNNNSVKKLFSTMDISN